MKSSWSGASWIYEKHPTVPALLPLMSMPACDSLEPGRQGVDARAIGFPQSLAGEQFDNLQGIDSRAIYGQSPVEVRPGDSPRRSDFPKKRTQSDFIAGLH